MHNMRVCAKMFKSSQINFAGMTCTAMVAQNVKENMRRLKHFAMSFRLLSIRRKFSIISLIIGFDWEKSLCKSCQR